MFVRTSIETVVLKKATHPGDFFFFHFCRKEKYKKINIHRVGRGEKEIPKAKNILAGGGPPGPVPPFPFTRRVLLVRDGSVPF